MPQMDIRRYVKHGTLPQMRLFEASARLGSFAGAARELHLAPPTASVQIKKLTETVGLPLFEQIGRQIHLTEAGSRLYARCDEVFRALRSLEEDLESLRGLRSGHLRVAIPSAGRSFVPRLLGSFVDRHPGIETSLAIHNEGALAARLAADQDDLYMFANVPQDRELVVQTILANPLVVMARRDHPLAHARKIPFARLATEPFLLREPGSGTRNMALTLFQQHGATARVKMELSSNEAVREAILAGVGVSIVPRYVFGTEAEPAGLVCLDVEGFPIEGHWHFVYPVGKHASPAMVAFMDFTRTEASRLARGASAARPESLPAEADAAFGPGGHEGARRRVALRGSPVSLI